MTPAQLAEAATLGSLLHDSTRLPQIAGWLKAEDFADPWHGQVWTALREQHAAGTAVRPTEIGDLLVDRLGMARADLPRVADLLAAAPDRPRPEVYALMVLEASLRRQVASRGVLLRAAALSSSLRLEFRPVLAVTTLVDHLTDAAETRWRTATTPTGSRVAGPLDMPSRGFDGYGPAARAADRTLAADRLLSAHPDLGPVAAREHERDLVAGLIVYPQHLPCVAGWLRPQLLTDRRWRAAYTAAVELAEQGDPVDAITVAWHIQGRGGPGPSDLTSAVDAAIATDPGYSAWLVAADITRRTAASAACCLTTAAGNLGLELGDVFTTARQVASGVRAVASVLPIDAEQTMPVEQLRLVTRDPQREPAGRMGPVAG